MAEVVPAIKQAGGAVLRLEAVLERAEVERLVLRLDVQDDPLRRLCPRPRPTPVTIQYVSSTVDSVEEGREGDARG